MDWLNSRWEWLSKQGALWWWLFAVSAVLLVVSPLVAAWIVVRLPSDYFVEPRRQKSSGRPQNPALSIVARIGRNLLGAVLLIAGLVMLVTPGQGLLSIVVGLGLLDFPGKYRLQRWLIMRKPVWRSINWLRRRASHEELKKPN
jgi:hypothetical protein